MQKAELQDVLVNLAKLLNIDFKIPVAVLDKKDEEKLQDKILTHRVRVGHGQVAQDATLGELILICDAGYGSESLSRADAEQELRRVGILVEDGFVYIANKSDPMKKILADTPWALEWGRPLRDVFDAELTNAMYFNPGILSRATKLPIKAFKE